MHKCALRFSAGKRRKTANEVQFASTLLWLQYSLREKAATAEPATLSNASEHCVGCFAFQLFLKFSSGTFSTRKDAIQSSLDRIKDKQTNLERKYEMSYNRYLKQFTQMNSIMTQMNQTMSMFNAQK